MIVKVAPFPVSLIAVRDPPFFSILFLDKYNPIPVDGSFEVPNRPSFVNF
jgi:hypothetical protein